MKIIKLTKDFGKQRGLFNFSLTLNTGDIVGIIGANGSGKSTLMKMLSGIICPDCGDFDQIRTSYVAETRSLYPELTVKENILFYEIISGNRFCIHNDPFNIINIMNSRVTDLSKGNQQKVQITCGLICDPKLLLLDEPLSGLDEDHLSIVKKVLFSLSEKGVMIMISSHLKHELNSLCNRLVYLQEGMCIGEVNLLSELPCSNGWRVRFPITYQTRYINEKNIIMDTSLEVILKNVKNNMQMGTQSIIIERQFSMEHTNE